MYKRKCSVKVSPSVAVELRKAKRRWGPLHSDQLERLRHFLANYCLSPTLGDLTLINGHWYVTHSGLLRLARTKQCRGIHATRIPELCNPSVSRWAFKARVYTSSTCKGFIGFADADPTNVPAQFRGCEMRIAETRAVNRALRKAYGIGLCSVEELAPSQHAPAGVDPGEGSANVNAAAALAIPRTPVRDRLCRVIRTYHLDPEPVKRYAADFCGVSNLREAGREMVEDFVNHIEERAAQGRDALIAQLRSYASEKERKHEAD
jgi:hypothetical protein